MTPKSSPRTLSRLVGACASLALVACASGASAAAYVFTGTQHNVDAPTGPAAARCGARVSVTIGNGPLSSSTGTSNLGAFSTSQSHCLTPPLPTTYDLGEFEYDFGSGDTLLGTYDGVLMFDLPGVFLNSQDFVVTGGTGLFAGASGGFHAEGYVSFLGATPEAGLAFIGGFTTPDAGVPEPATWAMMIMGFGLSGAMARRRRSNLA